MTTVDYSVIPLDKEETDELIKEKFFIENNGETKLYYIILIKKFNRYYLNEPLDAKINFILFNKFHTLDDVIKLILEKPTIRQNKKISNIFNINRTKKNIKKIIDFDKLYESSINIKITNNIISSIPKDLIFSNKQIYYMIEKEIKKINSNIEYKHTIEPIDMNPYLLQVNLFFDDKLGQILIENFGNNIVKFNLKINNKY